jgi:hypothetical protein
MSKSQKGERKSKVSSGRGRASESALKFTKRRLQGQPQSTNMVIAEKRSRVFRRSFQMEHIRLLFKYNNETPGRRKEASVRQYSDITN